MNKEIMDQVSKLTQTSFDTMKKIATTNQNLTEKLFAEQADLVNSVISTSEKSANALKNVKDLNDLTSLATAQSELAQKQMEQFMETTRSCADALTDAANTYKKLFEASAETATKAASSTVASVSSATRTTSSKAA